MGVQDLGVLLLPVLTTIFMNVVLCLELTGFPFDTRYRELELAFVAVSVTCAFVVQSNLLCWPDDNRGHVWWFTNLTYVAYYISTHLAGEFPREYGYYNNPTPIVVYAGMNLWLVYQTYKSGYNLTKLLNIIAGLVVFFQYLAIFGLDHWFLVVGTGGLFLMKKGLK